MYDEARVMKKKTAGDAEAKDVENKTLVSDDTKGDASRHETPLVDIAQNNAEIIKQNDGTDTTIVADAKSDDAVSVLTEVNIKADTMKEMGTGNKDKVNELVESNENFFSETEGSIRISNQSSVIDKQNPNVGTVIEEGIDNKCDEFNTESSSENSSRILFLDEEKYYVGNIKDEEIDRKSFDSEYIRCNTSSHETPGVYQDEGNTMQIQQKGTNNKNIFRKGTIGDKSQSKALVIESEQHRKDNVTGGGVDNKSAISTICSCGEYPSQMAFLNKEHSSAESLQEDDSDIKTEILNDIRALYEESNHEDYVKEKSSDRSFVSEAAIADQICCVCCFCFFPSLCSCKQPAAGIEQNVVIVKGKNLDCKSVAVAATSVSSDERWYITGATNKDQSCENGIKEEIAEKVAATAPSKDTNVDKSPHETRKLGHDQNNTEIVTRKNTDNTNFVPEGASGSKYQRQTSVVNKDQSAIVNIQDLKPVSNAVSSGETAAVDNGKRSVDSFKENEVKNKFVVGEASRIGKVQTKISNMDKKQVRVDNEQQGNADKIVVATQADSGECSRETEPLHREGDSANNVRVKSVDNETVDLQDPDGGKSIRTSCFCFFRPRPSLKSSSVDSAHCNIENETDKRTDTKSAEKFENDNKSAHNPTAGNMKQNDQDHVNKIMTTDETAKTVSECPNGDKSQNEPPIMERKRNIADHVKQKNTVNKHNVNEATSEDKMLCKATLSDREQSEIQGNESIEILDNTRSGKRLPKTAARDKKQARLDGIKDTEVKHMPAESNVTNNDKIPSQMSLKDKEVPDLDDAKSNSVNNKTVAAEGSAKKKEDIINKQDASGGDRTSCFCFFRARPSRKLASLDTDQNNIDNVTKQDLEQKSAVTNSECNNKISRTVTADNIEQDNNNCVSETRSDNKTVQSIIKHSSGSKKTVADKQQNNEENVEQTEAENSRFVAEGKKIGKIQCKTPAVNQQGGKAGEIQEKPVDGKNSVTKTIKGSKYENKLADVDTEQTNADRTLEKDSEDASIVDMRKSTSDDKITSKAQVNKNNANRTKEKCIESSYIQSQATSAGKSRDPSCFCFFSARPSLRSTSDIEQSNKNNARDDSRSECTLTNVLAKSDSGSKKKHKSANGNKKRNKADGVTKTAAQNKNMTVLSTNWNDAKTSQETTMVDQEQHNANSVKRNDVDEENVLEEGKRSDQGLGKASSLNKERSVTDSILENSILVSKDVKISTSLHKGQTNTNNLKEKVDNMTDVSSIASNGKDVSQIACPDKEQSNADSLKEKEIGNKTFASNDTRYHNSLVETPSIDEEGKNQESENGSNKTSATNSSFDKSPFKTTILNETANSTSNIKDEDSSSEKDITNTEESRLYFADEEHTDANRIKQKYIGNKAVDSKSPPVGQTPNKIKEHIHSDNIVAVEEQKRRIVSEAVNANKTPSEKYNMDDEIYNANNNLEKDKEINTAKDSKTSIITDENKDLSSSKTPTIHREQISEDNVSDLSENIETSTDASGKNGQKIIPAVQKGKKHVNNKDIDEDKKTPIMLKEQTSEEYVVGMDKGGTTVTSENAGQKNVGDEKKNSAIPVEPYTADTDLKSSKFTGESVKEVSAKEPTKQKEKASIQESVSVEKSGTSSNVQGPSPKHGSKATLVMSRSDVTSMEQNPTAKQTSTLDALWDSFVNDDVTRNIAAGETGDSSSTNQMMHRRSSILGKTGSVTGTDKTHQKNRLSPLTIAVNAAAGMRAGNSTISNVTPSARNKDQVAENTNTPISEENKTGLGGSVSTNNSKIPSKTDTIIAAAQNVSVKEKSKPTRSREYFDTTNETGKESIACSDVKNNAATTEIDEDYMDAVKNGSISKESGTNRGEKTDAHRNTPFDRSTPNEMAIRKTTDNTTENKQYLGRSDESKRKAIADGKDQSNITAVADKDKVTDNAGNTIETFPNLTNVMPALGMPIANNVVPTIKPNFPARIRNIANKETVATSKHSSASQFPNKSINKNAAGRQTDKDTTKAATGNNIAVTKSDNNKRGNREAIDERQVKISVNKALNTVNAGTLGSVADQENTVQNTGTAVTALSKGKFSNKNIVNGTESNANKTNGIPMQDTPIANKAIPTAKPSIEVGTKSVGSASLIGTGKNMSAFKQSNKTVATSKTTKMETKPFGHTNSGDNVAVNKISTSKIPTQETAKKDKVTLDKENHNRNKETKKSSVQTSLTAATEITKGKLSNKTGTAQETESNKKHTYVVPEGGIPPAIKGPITVEPILSVNTQRIKNKEQIGKNQNSQLSQEAG